MILGGKKMFSYWQVKRAVTCILKPKQLSVSSCREKAQRSDSKILTQLFNVCLRHVGNVRLDQWTRSIWLVSVVLPLLHGPSDLRWQSSNCAVSLCETSIFHPDVEWSWRIWTKRSVEKQLDRKMRTRWKSVWRYTYLWFIIKRYEYFQEN